MVYVCSLPLTPLFILSFVSSQVAPLMQPYKHVQHQLYFTGMIPVVICYMNALELPPPPFHPFPAKTKNVRIYIETALVVVISYVSLLIISWSYIWLIVFPIIAIGFIAALCSQLSYQDLQDGGSKEQGEGLEAAALVPYWALCVMGQLQAEKFAVSQFLLFFSFMLGALSMMMSRLVGLASTAVHRGRGIAPASELLRKASLVMLLVAVHTVVAELLGENALIFCLPEIVPVLLWLSVRLDHDDGATISVDRIKLDLDMDSRVLVLLGAAPAAVLAILAAGYMDESVPYWSGKALVSCAVSLLLTYYDVFMLCQWLRGGHRDGTLTSASASSSLQEAVNLLEFWANVLLAAVVTLLVFTSLASAQLVLLQGPVASASASQILERLCHKFLQFII